MILLVLAGGIAAGGVLVDSRYRPPPVLAEGRLTVAPAATGRTSVGAFTVDVRRDGLTVRNHAGRVVWASPGDHPVLAALRGHVEFTSRIGSVTTDTDRSARLVDQTVTQVGTGPGGVVLRGRLGAPGARSSAYELRLDAPDPQRLQVHVTVPGADAVVLRIGAGRAEQVHGLGEQFTSLNLRGRFVPILSREQGVGRGREPLTALAELTKGSGGDATTTYTAIPFLVTDRDRGLAVDSERYTAVDLRPRDRFDVTTWNDAVQATLYSAPNDAQVLADHTADTGRMQPLPAWTQRGAIVAIQGGTAAIRTHLVQLQRAGVKVTGVWLQDWTGLRTTSFGTRAWWNWELDPARFPHWQQLVAHLHAQGVHLLGYVNPFLAGPDERPGTRRDLYAEAKRRGFLVTHRDGSPYLIDQGDFSAAMVDLSNPAAAAWLSHVIATQMAGIGFDGWMADYGEELPFDARIAGGDPVAWHNRWPDLWAKVNHDACVEAGKPHCVFFMRAAAIHTAGTAPLFWAGDQTVSWDAHDGLASAVHGVLAAGVSGMTLDHTDVGGYTTLPQPFVRLTRGPELLERWAELGAWSVVMRTHEGNLPDRNTQAWDPAVIGAFARQTRVFAALAGYRDEVERTAAATGLPAWRPMWLAAAGTAAAGDDNEFFFGAHVLVAPVLHRGARTLDVTLPPGRWVHVWTGKTYGDPHATTSVTVPAPIGQPGVFVRAGDPVGAQLRGKVLAAWHAS